MVVSEYSGIDQDREPRSRVESAQIGLRQAIRGQGLFIDPEPRFRHGAQARIRRFHAA